jgi:NTE family protein
VGATHLSVGGDDPLSPVRRIPPDEDVAPSRGTGLCLSGGGYRAMLFHLGVLWRLNEAGWLRRLDRISSVSGGSITSAVLGLAWSELDFDEHGVARVFEERVVAPVRGLARHGIDIRAVLSGLVSPQTIAERVAAAYRRHLFDGRTLQDLPAKPRFIINATNVGSGALLRFEREQVADWRLGRVERPEIEVAVAVACSSAFPPVLSPYRLRLADADWVTEPSSDLALPDHRDEVVLSDGGVYDNLGLETVWKRCRTVIVSDAGGQLAPDPQPDRDWPQHFVRVLRVIDSQVRALRKGQTIESLRRGDRDGVYLGIRSHMADFRVEDPMQAPPERTILLAEVPTRLDALDDAIQERLVNWGYAICDAGLRRHLDPDAARPLGFPYRAAAV